MIDLRARKLFFVLVLLASACASAPKPMPVTAAAAAPAIQVPTGRLPHGVRPLAYTLELTIVPNQERFSGRVQIAVQIDTPSQLVWLHGRELHVSSVRALVGQESIAASYTQMSEDGAVALNFAKPLPAGSAVLELVYDAPFGRQLKGLYRVDSGGNSYAFTQFEAISARWAFPCFDEPDFKTNFDVWLTVPASDVAVSNTKMIAEEPAGPDLKRVHFAQTKPLPTYLVALAVGPLDVVDGPAIAPNALRTEPVPLRGIAVKGKGAMLAHALAEAGPMLSALERYFGIPYAYDKLDLVAVPDFAAGAMENAGLITFREWLLLLDGKHASEGQLRANAYVTAHELAHQWVGDLVTMHYWDDIWLNEAFATWMGNRVLVELHPEYKAELSFAAAIEGAMSADSQVSARMIRQPITSTHDILNAFDSITYSKGGGVLAMFERFLGVPVFQKGVQSYLMAHAHGNASTEDLLDALSASAGRDVKTPFFSFLTQVGVPLLAAELHCEGGKAELRLHQERYLPLGSTGSREQRWQIPVCARYESAGAVHESCTLLSETTGSLALEGNACPSWVMPNAQAAGYYRFTMPSTELERLRNKGFKKLSGPERYAVVQALNAGVDSGTIAGKDVLAAARTFVADDTRTIAEAPIAVLRFAHDQAVPEALRPTVATFTRELYTPLKNRLGFREQHGENGETKLLRAAVLNAVADLGRDSAVRKKLASLGKQYLGLGSDNALHEDAVPSDLVDLALRVLVEDGDDMVFDMLYGHFIQTDEPTLRARLLHALGAVRDARSQKALALVLDPQLHVNEVATPLGDQLRDVRTREAAWQWFEQHFDAVVTRLSPEGAGFTPWFGAGFCSEAMANRLETFFAPHIASLGGGPRSLAGAVEAVRLCAAKLAAQGDSIRSFFDPHYVASKPPALVQPPSAAAISTPVIAVSPAAPPALSAAPAASALSLPPPGAVAAQPIAPVAASPSAPAASPTTLAPPEPTAQPVAPSQPSAPTAAPAAPFPMPNPPPGAAAPSMGH